MIKGENSDIPMRFHVKRYRHHIQISTANAAQDVKEGYVLNIAIIPVYPKWQPLPGERYLGRYK